MGIKRDKNDAVFSDSIRERDDWTCQRCGRVSVSGQIHGKSREMECSHFYGRGTGTLNRFGVDNCDTFCKGCHKYFTHRPAEYAAWKLNQLGATRYDWLTRTAHKVHKRTKAEWKDLYAYYKDWYQKAREKRKEGMRGPLELIGFDSLVWE